MNKEEKELLNDLEKLKNELGALGNPHYDFSKEQKQDIQIKIDPKVPPAKFIPSKIQDHIWYANELTFRAMKKDIFFTHDEELSQNYRCECKQEFDLQFWLLCPYCGTDIKK